MQLIIKDNTVLATYPDSQQIDTSFLDRHHPGCEVAAYDGAFDINPEGDNADPRSEREKALAYRDRRRAAYPAIADQLDMLYRDVVDGTTVWRDTIAAVKQQHPKPQQ